MKYVEISQTCPECGNRLPCKVKAGPEFAYCEPDYPVQCGYCRKTVRVELPGPPIDINTAAPPPGRPRLPKFPRWPMQRLGELLWRLVPPAVFKILEPQIDWEAVCPPRPRSAPCGSAARRGPRKSSGGGKGTDNIRVLIHAKASA